MNKDVVIVDHVTRLSYTEVNPRLLEDLTIQVKNIRKYRRKIERRKLKIKRIYG
jgi:hypothetical protein